MQPIIKEVTINAPAEAVWKAITNRDEMQQWYFDIAEFRAEPGFEFRFTGQSEDSQREFAHLCKVTEVIPMKKLSYTWRYENREGNSLVTFELFEENGATRVKLTHEGVETFAANGPDFVKTNFEAGWNEIIGKLLKQHVEKAG